MLENVVQFVFAPILDAGKSGLPLQAEGHLNAVESDCNNASVIALLSFHQESCWPLAVLLYYTPDKRKETECYNLQWPVESCSVHTYQ